MRTKRTFWLNISLLLIASLILASCAPAVTPTPAATQPPPAEPAATQAPAEPVATEPPAAPAVTEAPAEPVATEEPAPPAAEPKVLKARLTKDIGNLDPAFIVGSEDDQVDRAVMDGLIRFNAAGEIENQLAETIETSEDGLVISFKLKEGIQWQRGYGELTTEDVKFSFERFIDPELDAAYKDDYSSLDHVEIVSKYEGKIILKEPQATFWTTTLPLTSGLIVCKKFVEEVGLEKFKTDIVGTGPYELVEWKPTERLVLKRNPAYWGTPPYFDEIQLFPIDDDKAAEVALQAGEIDFGIISLASTEQFQTDPAFKLEITPSFSYSWIGLNIENPKLQDVNVRQAIRYGIDVPSILIAAYNDLAPQANTLVPPGVIGHWADAPVYQRDVAKAKEYLAAAGLSTLDLNLAIQDTSEYRTWAEIAQANLAEVGININILPLDASTFWDMGSGDKGKEVELFAIGYSSVSPEPAWFSMWFTCDQVGVWNWMRWCDSKFDELHQEGIRTLDPAKREPIYIEMQKLWDEAVISVWVTNTPLVYTSKPNINFVIYPGGLCPMLREFTATD